MYKKRYLDKYALTTPSCQHWSDSGARPTNDISISFEIRPKFAVLWFKIYSTDHNEILHKPRQCNCRGVCKISLWSVEHILNYSAPNFDRISVQFGTAGRHDIL